MHKEDGGQRGARTEKEAQEVRDMGPGPRQASSHGGQHRGARLVVLEPRPRQLLGVASVWRPNAANFLV